jgi:hypothetical protein
MSATGQKQTYAPQKSMSAFAPNSDRESEIPQKAMSALPPKADMCVATRDVRFGPIADIRQPRWRNSRVMSLASKVAGTVTTVA